MTVGDPVATGYSQSPKESNVSEKCNNGGPGVGLLLLIPAVAVAAHVAKRHHRMMWDDLGGAESATRFRGHGRHRFAGPDSDPAARDSFRLPPRIQWILDTWHTRAHQADKPAEAPPAAG